MQPVDKNIQWYQSKFKTFEQSLNGERSTPVHALRRDAIHRFAELGFPTTRQEEWRFTNVSPISKIEFQPILQYEPHGITRERIEEYLLDGAIHKVFVNGMYSSELSDVGLLPAGLVAGSLAETLKKHPETVQPYLARLIIGEESAFTALNTAFLVDGGFVSLPENIQFDQPIQFLFLSTDHEKTYAAQPRNLILIGAKSTCKIVETYVGLAHNRYLSNTVTEIILGENSVLEHDKLQIENMNAFHVGTTQVRMNEASRFTSNAISLGGLLVRNNITVVYDAEKSECTLNGLSLGTGMQIIDSHTVIDHAKPHCNSHELYKAILDGASKGVFNGKIFVRKDAQKTDAKQTNKTLLLSDDATINAKPQLEIFADDVKCTHGATIGQLDEEQVFYLRSRGINLASARDMLTTAFAGDVITKISLEPLRLKVEKLILAKLGNRSLKKI